VTVPTLLEWLTEQPFALALSSGFFGFFAHAGVLAALEDAGLRPTRITGSSAGALAGGLYAAGLDAIRLRDELFALRREHFWDPGLGVGILRGRLLLTRLTRVLPVESFAECRIPLALSAYEPARHRTRVLDSGALAPAIAASCALPVLFQPVSVGGHRLLDGGVLDRPGMQGMPRGERVLYHHLVPKSVWRLGQSVDERVRYSPLPVSLVIHGLPRVGPFALEAGLRAFEGAERATRLAFRRRVECARVSISLALS
jgi:NTE family protein